MEISRRDLVKSIAGTALCLPITAQMVESKDHLFILTDDDTLGILGERDLEESNYVNPDGTRNAKANFIFPDDANDGHSYGIDVSHHMKTVPWKDLRAGKCDYVYVKCSQATRGIDDHFEAHWRGAAEIAKLPVGAYHFLCPGRTGKDQADFFLGRLRKVNGLSKGCLQPVVDLEWDTYGPDFKRIPIGVDRDGKPKYKDYWDGVSSDEIVKIVQGFVDTVRAASKNNIVPLVYTNRTWWESHLTRNAQLTNCTIWISDYRNESYRTQQPRSVAGHVYDLWQFSETGHIRSGGTLVGPVDCNKLVHGDVSDLLIT